MSTAIEKAAMATDLVRSGFNLDLSSLLLRQRGEALELISLMFRTSLANLEGGDLGELAAMRQLYQDMVKNMTLSKSEREWLEQQMTAFLFAQDIRVLARN